MSNNRSFSSPVRFFRGRFSALLIALLLLFLLHVFLADHPLTHYALPVFLLVILLANIHALGDDRRVSLIASMLGLAALALRWAMYVSESQALLLIGEGVGALFFAFTAVAILALVLRTQTVTGDTVSGALCVYLLMGIMWAFLYMLLESVHPGTFRFAVETKIATDTTYPPPAFLSRFIYFSFVTLSTVGYGDIIPLTGPARGLATLEGIVGQFYLAVLVARFVGLHLVHSQR
jgi:Ion channel